MSITSTPCILANSISSSTTCSVGKSSALDNGQRPSCQREEVVLTAHEPGYISSALAKKRVARN